MFDHRLAALGFRSLGFRGLKIGEIKEGNFKTKSLQRRFALEISGLNISET